MDVVAGLLDGPRARGAFLLRSHLSAPWGMRIEDEAPLTIVPVLRGSGWVGAAVSASGHGRDVDRGVQVEEGDVVLLRGPDHYVVADSPATAPQVVIGPTEVCRAIDGGPSPMTVLGVRSWGNDPDGETVIVTGTYPLDGEVGRRILRVLPPRVVLRSGQVDTVLVEMLAREVVQDLPGQEAVLDRLLDLLLISCLRTWLSGPDAPGWYRADADPVVGAALRLIHHDPARAWSVESLAREVGLSRAAFSRRFTELVGEPPMAYLTGWRLDLAADLLLADDATVASVARAVGYGTPFALSSAFKRVRGVSPAVHRARARAA
ncbi:AraC family transcriptional regulator [Cellulosimicrobium arenosum]|uniref:AraC family transcriptional regulator n=1 Tax=Cellulosimicrobium arenosum TaxID=2708133 RepID=A0A927J070_9MICO|nr:AraC family transcriptional regulator [Cellulosimicrobium arenosum]MBD8079327.1 AraC family transcriptional regulator [Cellulosimicrobium arenosum]